LADANTGSSGLIRVDVSNSGGDVGNNRSLVSWAFYLIERAVNNSTFGSATASVDWIGQGQLWSGSFSFDWRGAGQQVTTIAAGNFAINHNPDGTGSVTIGGNMNATGTGGAGGPASVAQGINLTKLSSAPGTPTGVAAARVTDTQINLTWAQSSPSNGQPDSNQIDRSVNGGAFERILDIAATNSASISAAANQKLIYRVSAWNGYVGSSGTSAPSTPIYTTPAAPSNVVSTKSANLDIWTQFVSNVAYSEHEHEIWHGVVGVGWDAAPLATLPAGTLGYNHVAPSASQVHVYMVRSKAAGLYSTYTEGNSVQLLVAPNKPTVPAMPAVADKTQAVQYSWIHNSVDTSPQRKYEMSLSSDGGVSWSSQGVITTPTALYTLPGNTFPANTNLQSRVRTWGSATTGGAEGTGASPWSDTRTLTFKTVPTATVTVPANGSVLNDSTVRVTVGFAQPEGAIFVQAIVQLYQGATLLYEGASSIQSGITIPRTLANGQNYTVQARVQDSNGLWSAWGTSTFSVTYLQPVPAGVTVSYLPETGFGQLNLTIPAPGAGQSAATKVTITRKINGVEEVVVRDYPTTAAMTFLDTTPTIHGTNLYTVTTTSALGSQVSTTATLVTAELRRAFLSKGPGFDVVGVFGANLSVDESLSVASDTVEAAGRTKPIGLYGVETSVKLKVSSFLYEGFGSDVDKMRSVLLVPGKACYRDASGRRVFGTAEGSVSYKRVPRGDLSFTIVETS
jgi:hypothetical protein